MRILVGLIAAVSVSIFASVYMIDLSFDSTNLTINATETVHWQNPLKESTSIALFNLFPNLHSEKNPYVSRLAQSRDRGWIEIEHVWVDGKDASFTTTESFVHMYQRYSKDKTLLVVNLGRSVTPNQEVEIRIKFKTKFPKSGMDEGCYGGLCLWRFGWYPLEVYSRDGRYYDGAVYTPHTCLIKEKAPKGWDVVYHEGTGIGCPIAFLKDYDSYEIDGKDYTVIVHYFKGLKDKAMKIGVIALHALQKYTKRFGKLDYNTVHIIQSPYSHLFGMTAPGIITLGDNAFTTADLILPGFTTPLEEFLVYHEVAHLWFGLGASVDFEKTNFLSESLAQYSAITQLESERGATENVYESNVPDILTKDLKKLFLLKSIRENYLYYYREMHREGIDWKVAGKAKYLNQDFPRNYAKGYFAFKALSNLFDNFDDVLKKYIRRFKGKIVTYEDFKNFMLSEKKDAGKALKKLFESENGLDAKVVHEKDGVLVEVPDGIPCKVSVVEKGKRRTFTVDESTKLTGPLDRVDVDPDWSLPDPDRFNNHYPALFNNPFKSEYSPLEAYDLLIGVKSGYTSYNDVYTSVSLGLRKFDEFSYSFLAGSYYTIEGTNMVYRDSVYGASGWYSPNPFVEISGMYLGTIKPIYVGAMISFTFPEKTDIGYDMPYLVTRNYFHLGGEYSGEMRVWGEYDFVDLNKLATAFGVYGSYNLYSSSWNAISQISYFPTDFVSLSAAGLISSDKDIPVYDSTYMAYGVIQAGIHLDLDSDRRTNIFNLMSFRGIHVSLKPGFEVGYSGRYDYFGSIEMDLTAKLFTILDMPSLFGVMVKALFGSDMKFKGVYYGFGVTFDDSVLSMKNLNLSFLPSPLLKSRIHLLRLEF